MGRHIILVTEPKGLATVTQLPVHGQMAMLTKIIDVTGRRVPLQQHDPDNQGVYTLFLSQNFPSTLVQIHLGGPWCLRDHVQRSPIIR